MTDSPYFKTAIYYAAFLGLGMSSAVLGPSLPFLAEQTGVQLKQASLLFSSINLGYLIGALLSGRQYDRRRGHPVMAAALIAMAAFVLLVPRMSNLGLLAFLMLALGLAQAFLDIGGNTLLVWLHRDRAAPFISGLHFFWGFGSFISPILLAQAVLRTGKIFWAYGCIAIFLLPVAFLLKGTESSEAPHKKIDARLQKNASWSLLALFVFFFLTFTGAEAAYGGWIYSFAIAMKTAAPPEAAYLTSAYWGSLTLSRLVLIPFAARYPPRTLLIANLIGAMSGLALAFVAGGSLLAVWAATLIFGASIATMFPLTLSYANKMITVTGQFTSWIFIGVSLGGMFLPWLIGQFFEQIGPQIMAFILIVNMLICTGFFVLLSKKKTQEPVRFASN